MSVNRYAAGLRAKAFHCSTNLALNDAIPVARAWGRAGGVVPRRHALGPTVEVEEKRNSAPYG